MAKSADAFRTISEVAEWLGSPAHVLRFWESKFTQVKPVKRAGGRRYYRPADMLLLGGIKKLLHDDGMTIKGVQKILREQGVKHVSGLSHPLDEDFGEAPFEADAVPEPTPQDAASDSAQVLQFQREEADTKPSAESASPSVEEPPVEGTPASDTRVLEDFAASEAPSPTETAPSELDENEQDALQAPEPEAPAAELQAEPEPADEPEPAMESEPEPEPTVTPDAASLPAFLHRTPPPARETDDTVEEPIPETSEPADAPAPIAAASEPEPEPAAPEPESPRPAIIDLPDDPADDAIDAAPGLLATLAKRKGHALPNDVLARVSAERDKLAAFVARQTGG